MKQQRLGARLAHESSSVCKLGTIPQPICRKVILAWKLLAEPAEQTDQSKPPLAMLKSGAEGQHSFNR